MPIKTKGVIAAPAYDREFAEKAVAQVEPISPVDYGVGYPTGSRVHSRQSDNRAEMELFRPVQTIPRKQRDIIEACTNTYYRVGLLRNVIDMMSSFGCQGIQVLHPSKSRQKIYSAWFHHVRGPERSERFLNSLYRSGNVVIKKTMGKLTASDLRDLQSNYITASFNPEIEYERMPKPGRNVVPIEYTFLNPHYIETAGGQLATFLRHPVYQLRVPNFIITMIRTPKTPTEQQLVADLPPFIREPIQRGEKFILLDNDKLSVYHYMKDDWQQWAMPLTYSILGDLILYEKMKLADLAALEGAISHIRIWKLGDLQHGIQVGPAMFEKLQSVLQNNPGGGSIDLLWDAAIDLLETSTDISNFLGSTKYEPVLKSIFAGLGIPASLTGGGNQGAGFTNNAISLKTLIERLQYGRDLLSEFWTGELRILQEAFGDPKPARIVFDNMSLYDEAAEKMLWFQMYDRHLVDDSTMQEKFGLVPEVIAMRIKSEEKAREVGKKPPKATPFHDPQADHELTKIALQQGTLAPTEAGVEKQSKKPGDKSVLDFQTEQAAKNRALQKQQQEAQIEMDKQKLEQGNELHQQQLQHNEDNHKLQMKHKDQEHTATLPIKIDMMRKKSQLQLKNQKKGVPGQGRPKNAKDSGPRKRKTPKPSVKASLDMFSIQRWAKDTQQKIAGNINKHYLDGLGKKTLRSLTTVESDLLEKNIFAALCSLKPFTDELPPVDEYPLPYSIPNEVEEVYMSLVAEYTQKTGSAPPIDERREMQSSAYAIWRSSEE